MVRELESVIERSVILADHDVIDLTTLPQKLQEPIGAVLTCQSS